MGPVSYANPSRSNRPRAPPYVAERSYTVTRCPATASRAAAAIAPIPAPITAIRAMEVDLSGRIFRRRAREAVPEPAAAREDEGKYGHGRNRGQCVGRTSEVVNGVVSIRT